MPSTPPNPPDKEGPFLPWLQTQGASWPDFGETIPPERPRQFAFVPIFIENANKRPPVPQLSWWTVCIRWFQYHSIQIRWYFERRVARLLHRRWSGQ